MKIIISSLLILSIILSLNIFSMIPANAEELINENSDSKIIKIDDTYSRLESKTPQVFDGNQWTNYIWSESLQSIKFESQAVSFEFDKASCAFKLYNAGLIGFSEPVIDSYSISLKIDGADEILPVCSIGSITTDSKGIHFTASRNDLKTIYDLDFFKGLEWTHDFQNNKGSSKLITITESCNNCIPDKIEGDKITFGSYILDTKNEIHNTVKDSFEDKGNYVINYEKSISNKEILSIDPSFSSNTTVLIRILETTSIASTCTGVVSSTASSSLETQLPESTGNNRCELSAIQYNITSIPHNAIITDVDITALNVTSIVGTINYNCDIKQINGGNITLMTTANLLADIRDGTAYVSNDIYCKTVANNYSFDLGTTADSDVQASVLAGNSTFALGFKATTETRTAGSELDISVHGDTPRLTIVYTNLPNLPTNLVLNTFSTSIINATWTQPSDCGTGCNGYRIWNQTSGAILVSNTTTTTTNYNFTGLNSGTLLSIIVAATSLEGVGSNSTAAQNYTITNPPTSLTATAVSSSQINLSWTPPSGTVTGYKIERESPTGGGFSTIVANTTTTTTTYSDTPLITNTQYNYRVSAHNNGGTSAVSNEDSDYTFGNLDAVITFNTNKTGDAIEVIPFIRLVTGSPDPTVTNVQILRNGTSVNNTAVSLPITIGQTVNLGRTFIEQLNANFVYNITGVITLTNSTGPFPFINSTTQTIVYTASYISSSEGGYFINYTHSRTNEYNDLNLVVSRQNLPANTECNFKDQLFEVGDWVNETNNGWYNNTISVIPTQNIYVTCYNDFLLFSFTSNGGNNATLAFVDYMNQLGTFAGVPIPFLFVILMAALFTGRSAITGIIFVAITIGVMGVMGYLPDANGDPAIGAATWALVIFLTGIGVFVGKKYF